MHVFRDWFFSLLKPESVALTVFALCVVAVLGLALGALRFRGVSLGIGGVLFAGLTFGHWLGDKALSEQVIEFSRDFGLILFVYTIGAQAGPGFLASLRKQGLPLNVAAASIVLLGVLLTIVVCKVGGVPMESAVGLFAGGTTNTPSLAAAGQALREAKGFSSSSSAVAGYAIAYPFGIVGIILTMLLFRSIFKIDLDREAKIIAERNPPAPPLSRVALEVTNPNIDGRALLQIPVADRGEVVISRILHKVDGVVRIAYPETVVLQGDILLAVGPPDAVEDLKMVVGGESTVDLVSASKQFAMKTILITRKEVLGRTVDELNLDHRYGLRATRVRRGDVELPPSPGVRLQFGDVLTVVGEEESAKAASQHLGNSVKQLNHPQVVPIFIGIALGVILGSIPVAFPGLPAPVKLGLAGGPLAAALILSRLGHLGPLVWYMPQSANLALRELGICLFLASVGVKSGGHFFHTLTDGPGLYWLACGAVITAVPLLLVGFVARSWMKLDFMSLCGLLAGSMTDPPALQFAGAVTQSESPGIAYAAVYPLVMLMRVLAAQVLVLAFV
ncbi:putative transporter [Humisphaera borealis]|uniref:Putative transporter n=1 Tax=Humisphaera borealis TaxID=2807512 RepID=A0A7M2WVH0_9BACT|nr:putative transporter [Humisphaera borealis]QOV89456.1 putative transporter [Humisphaera borealis]